ncbi:FMN-binding protein [Granulibacter bethesdensis]|uniref:FMN-binding protein n=1 Tax=Granulibacter bethesdensis TaxID=364410 RepID=UPI00090BDE9D|nr:FMN-binding protein [Granulibacter bethesdensis]APH60041.1 Na(+)-translocating NADH-quinone reductase subunit C [Granulibacter bethesdensis]
MKNRFFLLASVPAAIIGCAAYAETYFTVAQVQALMFPGQTLTEDFRKMTDAQKQEIENRSNTNVEHHKVKLWRAPDGGALMVDQVTGKHEYITYAVAIDKNGAVRDIEIMDYRETYGGQIKDASWRQQFVGKTLNSPLTLEKDIRNISGGTLSARHITDGVRRLLTTYAVLYNNGRQ